MKRKAGPAVKQRAAERARAEASYRFGFTTTGNVAHLVDEYGYALCEAPILYRRDNLMGWPSAASACSGNIRAKELEDCEEQHGGSRHIQPVSSGDFVEIEGSGCRANEPLKVGYPGDIPRFIGAEDDCTSRTRPAVTPRSR